MKPDVAASADQSPEVEKRSSDPWYFANQGWL